MRFPFFRASQTRRASQGRRPALEALEERAVPTINVPTPGMPGPVTVTGTAGNDQFIIRLSSTATTPTLQFSDNNGSTFTNVAVSDVSQVLVSGLAGNDTLTIDNSNGLVGNALSNGLGIAFAGGSGTDKLILSGTPAGATVNETYNFGSTFGAGTILTSSGTGGAGANVSFTGTEGVTDTLKAASLTINATNNRDLLRLVNGDTTNGLATFRLESVNVNDLARFGRHGHSGDDQGEDDGDDQDERQGDDDRGDDDRGDDVGDNRGDDGLRGLNFSVPITFANKAAVTINTLGGNDFVLVNAPTTAAGLTSLTINGGAGFDVVAIRNLASSITTDFPQVERTLTALDQIFIEEIYQFRLNRFSDDGGMENWKGILNGHGRREVLRGILRSDEALGVLVGDLYQRLLGRTADQAGLTNFVNFLHNGGTLEQVITGIVTSAEFQSRAAQLGGTGTPQEQLVRTLYLTLLQRDASPAEVTQALNSISQSGINAVVNGILTSREFLTLEVSNLYQTLFHRTADLPGLTGWVNSHLGLLELREALMMSDEFFQNA